MGSYVYTSLILALCFGVVPAIGTPTVPKDSGLPENLYHVNLRHLTTSRKLQSCDLYPTVECYSNFDVEYDEEVTLVHVEEQAMDRCTGGSIVNRKLKGRKSFGCQDVGKNRKVKLEVTALNGKKSQCESIFTIVDKDGDCQCPDYPTVECYSNFDVEYDEQVTLVHVEEQAMDPCIGGSIIARKIKGKTSFECNEVGKNRKVRLEVTALNGKKSQCESIFTIVDKDGDCQCPDDPEAICKNVTTKIDRKTKAKLSYLDINDESKSGCGRKLKYLIDEDEFNCDDLPEDEDSKTFPVTLTVEEEDGGTDTCTSNVKVWDEKDYCCDEYPEAKCKEDFEVPVNMGYRRRDRVEAKELDDGSESNCDRDEPLRYSVANRRYGKYKKHYYFYCDDVDKNITLWLKVKERYWYGQYHYGKEHRYMEDTCNTKVKVEDTEKYCCTDKPDAKCMDKLNIELDASGTASIDYSYVNDGSEAKCDGSLTYKIDRSEFDCYDVLIPPLVTLTVTEDRFDRSNTCGVTATVIDKEDACLDNLPPMAIGFPENDFVEICWCHDLEAYIQFYSPEYNQTTNVTVKSDATGWLNIDNDSNFTQKIANITLSGSPGKYSKYGKNSYDVTFIATDDHDPPASTERNLHIHVNKCRGKYKKKKKGKGKYCGKKKI